LTVTKNAYMLITNSMSSESTKSAVAPFRRAREEGKRQTRRRILDAALRVFGREGILAAPTSAVAREAGVAHGSVFAHFGSQEGLIVAAIEDFGEAMSRRLHALAESGGGTREALASHLRGMREREDFYARLVVEAPLLPVRARQSLVLIHSAMAIHLASAVQSDVLAGRVKEMPLHLLYNTWIGLVHHYLANRELFAPGASVLKRRGGELLDHFMSLIVEGGGR
jgi:AcrR family transcriptional regulator